MTGEAQSGDGRVLRIVKVLMGAVILYRVGARIPPFMRRFRVVCISRTHYPNHLTYPHPSRSFPEAIVSSTRSVLTGPDSVEGCPRQPYTRPKPKCLEVQSLGPTRLRVVDRTSTRHTLGMGRPGPDLGFPGKIGRFMFCLKGLETLPPLYLSRGLSGGVGPFRPFVVYLRFSTLKKKKNNRFIYIKILPGFFYMH